MCDDAGTILRDYLLTLTDVTDKTGDHVYGRGEGPDGPQVWGVLCEEVDASRSAHLEIRTALVQVTVFSADRQWNRTVAGIIVANIGSFAGFMGTTWLTVSHENEIETSEQIGAVYRWAYAIDVTLRHK